MKVAIASGKGGTGKTTDAASLTSVWPRPVYAADLDVEEPNLHLFLNPEVLCVETDGLEVPVPDGRKCTRYRACIELCQFNAIRLLGDVLMVFPEMALRIRHAWQKITEALTTPGRTAPSSQPSMKKNDGQWQEYN